MRAGSSTGGEHLQEATFLKLDCSKAHARLGWRPRWDLTSDPIVAWYKDKAARLAAKT
ncbi:MAG: Similar to CDP-glucose 4,6-dehydratase (EC [uncultured Caballeronia sp.]|nr:MAG: Similar to CDP-glucose 4,6-dehydratase (EC [uncultured Caballeronia sp.]